MQDAFGIVIFAVVAISAVIAVVSLFYRGKVYDEIGRGGIGDDREMPTPASGRAAPSTSPSATTRSARCSAPATPARPRAARPRSTSRASSQRLTAPAADPALRDEVRELVVARNRRREARGEAPLDVEAGGRAPAARVRRLTRRRAMRPGGFKARLRARRWTG